MALGATRQRVASMILRQGAILIALGLGAGIGLALATSQMVRSFLYHVQPTDVLTYVAVSLSLLAVGLFASLLPARKAASIEPMQALREDWASNRGAMRQFWHARKLEFTMPLFTKARNFLRNIFSFRSVDSDLDQEVHSHLEMLTEENIRAWHVRQRSAARRAHRTRRHRASERTSSRATPRQLAPFRPLRLPLRAPPVAQIAIIHRRRHTYPGSRYRCHHRHL